MPGSFFKFVGIDSINLRNSKHMRRANLGNQLLKRAKKAKWSKADLKFNSNELYRSGDMSVFKGGEHYILKGFVKTGNGKQNICVSLNKVIIDDNGGMQLKTSDEGLTRTDKSMVKRFDGSSENLYELSRGIPKKSDEPSRNLFEDIPGLYDEMSDENLDSKNSGSSIYDDIYEDVTETNEDSSNSSSLEESEKIADEDQMSNGDRASLVNKKRHKVIDNIANTIHIDENTSISDDLGDNLSADCNKFFTLPELIQVTYDVIKSLKKFHDQGINHGDIKEENILVKRVGKRIEANIIDPFTSVVKKIGRDRSCIGLKSDNTAAHLTGSGLFDQWLEKRKTAGSPFKDDYFSLYCIFNNMSHSYKKKSTESKFLNNITNQMYKYRPSLSELMKQIRSKAKRCGVKMNDN